MPYCPHLFRTLEARSENKRARDLPWLEEGGPLFRGSGQGLVEDPAQALVALRGHAHRPSHVARQKKTKGFRPHLRLSVWGRQMLSGPGEGLNSPSPGAVARFTPF